MLCVFVVISVSAAVLVLPSIQAVTPDVQPYQLDPCGSEDIQCTDQNNNTMLAYPENCAQYLLCTERRLHLKDCSRGQFFNNVTLQCTDSADHCQSPCPGGAYARALASSENPSQISLVADSVTRSPASLDVTKPGPESVTTDGR